jgi:HlyD family secretion protein
MMPEYREGDLVNPGRFVAEVLDMKQMEAAAKIYESDRSNVSAGQAAEISVDAQPQSSFQAKVKSIAGMASRQNFGTDTVRRFEVTFDLMNHGGNLRPGTSTQIVVRGNEMKDQLYLPSQCLFEKDGKLVIYVKHGDRFEATDAKIKFRTENRIAFENLAEGTEVALVNPEDFFKQQQKQSDSSPMGVGQ